MADIYDIQKRSKLMAAVKNKNSRAERLVFAYLNKKKIYYQKHYRKVVGSPDIALPRKKKAVFIDGDFWHGRTLESLLAKKSEEDYWIIKLRQNIERDKRQSDILTGAGWAILRIWESDINRVRSREAALSQIEDFLLRPRSADYSLLIIKINDIVSAN